MPAPVKIAKGSKQYLPVKVTDALEALTTLTGSDLRFSIYKTDEAETVVIANASCSNNGLIALPLVDAKTLITAEGLYKLFISFVASPEEVVLGPFFFTVDD